MNLDAKDFKHLQGAIILFAACLLVAGGAVLGTLHLKKQTTETHRVATAAQQEIDNKLSRARSEEQQLREMIGRFQMLKARGLIGPEQRLDWMETLSRIKGARRIFQLDYEFAPQRPADANILPDGAAAGGFQIMASQMRLTMQLLHEGDLLGFLDDLHTAAPALIQVRTCAIERVTRNPAERAASTQLTAECVLEWITLKEGK